MDIEKFVDVEGGKEKMGRITISLPQKLIDKLEDFAIQQKRSDGNTKSVSAIIRYALRNV